MHFILFILALGIKIRTLHLPSMCCAAELYSWLCLMPFKVRYFNTMHESCVKILEL